MSPLISNLTLPSNLVADGHLSLTAYFDIPVDIAFDLRIVVEINQPNAFQHTYSADSKQDHIDISWLPRGNYKINFAIPEISIDPGSYLLHTSLFIKLQGQETLQANSSCDLQVTSSSKCTTGHCWNLSAHAGTTSVDSLSWKQGRSSWFYKHFDHAARTIISYMLADSPLLRGRILDVGCGDGITDLGIVLRQEPEILIGIDPFKGYDRLPQILQDNHLSHIKLPNNLFFEAVDANVMPYPENSFDVVISWGSLEHIAGGYAKTLQEIRRVLKPNGLFFVHPGLYNSNFGHHLGEFCNEPFFHLTKTREEIRDIVFTRKPNYIDRAGEFASPDQYWQWFNELNPITVSQFETELRALDFEPWRVALRTEDLIEYSPKLQIYSMQDLATLELYVSCFNRKKK